MFCAASRSATVSAPVCTATAAAPLSDSDTVCRSLAVTVRPVSGISRERSADSCSVFGSSPSCCRASSTVSAVVQTSRCWPLIVRVSSRARSSAICAPSAIWVSAAGASTSCAPVCSPAEDSAPCTDPARVVTCRCSPSTVMVTCLAIAAAVPPPMASRPMVPAAATSMTLRRRPRLGAVAAALLETVLLERVLLEGAVRSVSGLSVSGGVGPPTLSALLFTSHPNGLVAPGQGEGWPHDA